MKLALVLGAQQGNTVKPRLQSIKDNLEIDCFASIPQFIDSSLKRNTLYDRILVLSTMLNTKTIKDLYEYWGRIPKETQVVVLCRASSDEQIARQFCSVFLTPLAAVMLVNSTTVQVIAEAALRPPTELNASYGIKDIISAEIDEDIAYIPEEPTKEVETAPTIMEAPAQMPDDNTKRTFFSALFGSKKSKNIKDNANNESKQTIEQEKSTDSELQPVVDSNEAIQQTEIKENVTDTYNNEFVEFNNDNSTIIEQPNTSETYIQEEDDSFDTTNNIIPDTSIEDSIESSTILDVSNETENEVVKQNCNVVSDDSSLVVEEDFGSDFIEEPIYEDVSKYHNDFAPQTVAVEEDFSGMSIEDDYAERKTQVIEESVDEDLSGMSIATDEDDYRRATEAPRVITKTVVKEVIRDKGDSGRGKTPTLSGIRSGKYHKIIVVTGDRCTGVTTTALALSKYLSEKIEVLYVDCDIDNHGVLNYLDYNQIANYESTHLNSIKMCKSVGVLDNCTIGYDNNFDLITTDFSCDATVEDLNKAHSVIAECADRYGVVVVDCPIDKLAYVPEFLLSGNTVLCVEGSKRGFMNMLCRLESLTISGRGKRNITSKGTMLVTKCPKSLDLPKLVKYIRSIFEPEDIDWFSMPLHQFNGQVNDKLLEEILEG